MGHWDCQRWLAHAAKLRAPMLCAALVGACTRETPPKLSTAVTPAARNAATSPQSGRFLLSRGEARDALCDLYRTLDVDCDKRITVLDQHNQCTHAPCALSLNVALGEQQINVTSLHHASQLATELAEGLSHAAHADSMVSLDVERALVDPVAYLTDRIERRYWNGLTRTISTSETELRQALADDKQSASQRQELRWCQPQARCSPETTGPAATGASSEAPHNKHYLYVPENDELAFRTYAPLERLMGLRVERVPSPISNEWVDHLTRHDKHGLLTLAHDGHGNALPFVVPGGRFNEMYGWDSYFIAWGLLHSGKLSLARAMAEHQAYEITHYGKVLNANRTYYLTRSQPPFFPALVRKVVDASISLAKPSPEIEPGLDGHLGWLGRMLQAAEREYDNVWSAAPRRTKLCKGDVCLARYFGEGAGQPPEVEFGHFAAFYQEHAVSHHHCPQSDSSQQSQRAFLACVQDLERAYTSGALADSEIDAFFVNDRCVRESGHDTTFRWFNEGKERCTDYVTVDLNSLLVQYELDVARLYLESAPEQRSRAQVWCERAQRRAELIRRYLWSEKAGAYFDYDLEKEKQSTYLAATTLYPLWVDLDNACNVSLVSPEQAQRLVSHVLPQLEAAGGLLASAISSVTSMTQPRVLQMSAGEVAQSTPSRQWEAPNGWAPHQMLAWKGLQQHGFGQDAQRLAYRWLLLIAENAANFHGTVPEKFDVVARTHRVFAEYGNVGTEFSYIATEGFGWMNASFLVGLDVLSPEQRALLTAFKPTESVF